jgi:hypothetical protein
VPRGYESGAPREVPDAREPNAPEPSGKNEPRDQSQEERAPQSSLNVTPEDARSSEPRTIHEIRGRTYRLRTSEIRAMLEVGKFRAIALEDLEEFVYAVDNIRMKPDIENLVRQGLVQMKAIPHEERASRQLLALTKPALRFLAERGFAGKTQALYHGFAKPREAHHDADLYRLYQKAAKKIECAGGRNLRVVLDYELKKRIYHDLARLGPDRASVGSKRAVAEQHGLKVVQGKIPLPDIRIEYETQEGERAHVDVELATSHYRLRNLIEKVRAGFSIYAHASDVSNLRRVLDQQELTAEILSL